MIALFWKYVISLLVWLSADPVSLDAEPARCAAAVAAARAAVVDQGHLRVGVDAVEKGAN
jgi:hypothetical protein